MVKLYVRIKLFLRVKMPLILMIGLPDNSTAIDSSFYTPVNNPNVCNDLDILYTNADQFLNKRDDLCMFITGHEPDIILVTEVLPKVHTQTITKAGLSLHGYTIFTNFDFESPTHSSIRGVAIFVSLKLSATAINFDSSDFKDHLWIKIHLKGSDSLLIGCIYRSPSGDIINSTTSICDLLRSINGYSHLLICGDFI